MWDDEFSLGMSFFYFFESNNVVTCIFHIFPLETSNCVFVTEGRNRHKDYLQKYSASLFFVLIFPLWAIILKLLDFTCIN